MLKLCSLCKDNKPLGDFYKRKSGLRAGQFYEKCKVCYKIRGRSYYQQNRIKQLELAKIRKHKYIEERKKFLEGIKGKECIDCGIKYPAWVMDFDHREGQKKISSVSKLAFRTIAKLEKIKEEIEKCDLVCANCHRQRTYERLRKKISAEVANVVKARV